MASPFHWTTHQLRNHLIVPLILLAALDLSTSLVAFEDNPLLQANGLSVTKCLDGFHESLGECKPCDCHVDGTKACDKTTGQCLCSHHVVGAKCDRCEENFFGLHGQSKTCQPCHCSISGSLTPNCDQITGQCSCRAGYRHRACDECEVSHYRNMEAGSLTCIPCNCHPKLSQTHPISVLNLKEINNQCDQSETFTHCRMNAINLTRECDIVSGQCVCSAEATGKYCDQCAPRHVLAPDNSTCALCGTCSSTLMDFLDEISQDLEYANKTIERGRLSATIGFKISELETSMFDHSIGLNSSARMLTAAMNLIGQHLGQPTNFTHQDVSLFIDKLETELNNLEFEVSNDTASSRNFGSVATTVSIVKNLIEAFNQKFELLSESKAELEQILENYQTNRTNTNDLIEFDNSELALITENSHDLLMNQTRIGKEIDSILTDLTSELIKLENLKLEGKNTELLQGEQLIASQLFNISLPFDECGNFNESINSIMVSMEPVIVGLVDLKDDMNSTQQVINSSIPKFSQDRTSMDKLTSLLRQSELRLDTVRNKFNETCLSAFASLIRNVDNMTSLDSGLFLLKNLTKELELRTKNISFWVDSELHSRQSAHDQYNELAFRDFHNLTNNWNKYFDMLKSPSEALDHLSPINDTLAEISKQIEASAPLNKITEFRHKGNTTEDPIELLTSNLTSLRAKVIDLEEESLSDKAELDRLNYNIKSRIPVKDRLSDDLNNLNELINENENLNLEIKAYTTMIGQIMDNFTEWQKDPHINLEIRSNSNFSAPTIEGEILNYLAQSGNNESAQILLSGEYLRKLESTVTRNVNSTEVSRITQMADIDMRRHVQDLQSKLGQIRLILNHLRVGREFNIKWSPNGQFLSYVRLKNPIDLSESSTYTSISFFIRPVNCSDGVIFFIGTPESAAIATVQSLKFVEVDESNGKPHARSQLSDNVQRNWTEYMAIELRESRIAVVVNLGSKNADEVVDDLILTSASWFKVTVVRMGNLLSITIKTDYSTTSFSRPLRSSRAVLNLDPTETRIFVGGMPQLMLAGENRTRYSTNQTNIPGIRSSQGFSGHIDDIRLNEHRLGLWNTVESDHNQKIHEKSILSRLFDNHIELNRPGPDSVSGNPSGICSYQHQYQHLYDEEASIGETFQFSNGYILFPAPGCGSNNSGPVGTEDLSTNRNSNSSLVNPMSLLTFKFRTGITNALLLLVQIPNEISNNFLVLQLNLGQLEMVIIENGTLLSSMPQQKPSITSNSLADHSWHHVECLVKSSLHGQSKSIQIRVDSVQKGQLGINGELSNLCASNILLGGLGNLETMPGITAHAKLQEMQLLQSISTSNFTGCLRSLNFSWFPGPLDIIKSKRVKNVRERACLEPVRTVSFPRPKSNISSSYVQFLNVDNELDDLLIEGPEQLEKIQPVGINGGHIRRLTIRFKTQQQNGLLVHHSRPDHSNFLSIFIHGGRLMFAFNFDKKVRFESHIVLSDGQWHMLHVKITKYLSDSRSSDETGSRNIRHKLVTILDDKYVYKDAFNIPIGSSMNQIGSGPSEKHSSKSSTIDNQVRVSRNTDSSNHGLASKLDESISNPSRDTNANLMSPHHGSSPSELMRKVLYFGGVEDKFIPLLRNQHIPTNFHGCIADVTINNIRLDFVQTNKNQGVLMNQCQLIG